MRPPRIAPAPVAGLRLLTADALPAASTDSVLPRGVYRAPYVVDNKAELLAIGDDGNLIRRVIIEPEWEGAVVCDLERALEAYERARSRVRLKVLQ